MTRLSHLSPKRSMAQNSGIISPIFFALLGVMSATIVLTIYHCITTLCRHRRAADSPVLRRPDVEAANSTELSTVQLVTPVLTFGEDEAVAAVGDDNTCAVCLSDFRDGEAVRLLPPCRHCFHVVCIDMWLWSHTSCPVCRTEAVKWIDKPGHGGGAAVYT